MSNRKVVVLSVFIAASFANAGSILISSFDSGGTVRQYDASSGAFISNFAVGGGLDGAGGMVFGPDGNLYVLSQGTSNILRYNGTTGASMGVFATGISDPVGLAFGSDGNLYAGGSFPETILKFNGTTGALIGTFATGNGLNVPIDLTFRPDGNLYVANALGPNVLEFNGTTGGFIGIFAANAALHEIGGMVFATDGNLYVTDIFGAGNSTGTTILKFNGTTGAFLGVFASGANLSGPSGITEGPDSDLYVGNFSAGNVVRYDLSGNFLGEFISKTANGPGTSNQILFSPNSVTSATPEPASWLLIASGLAVVIGGRRLTEAYKLTAVY